MSLINVRAVIKGHNQLWLSMLDWPFILRLLFPFVDNRRATDDSKHNEAPESVIMLLYVLILCSVCV